MHANELKSATSRTAKEETGRSSSPVDINEILDALIGPVLVERPVIYPSDGAILREHAAGLWNWLIRDINPELPDLAAVVFAPGSTAHARSTFSLNVANQISQAHEAAKQNAEQVRRMRVQMGGEEVYSELEHIQSAFRHQKLLPQAAAFGQAINAVSDVDALKLALNAFPVDDHVVSALMMHAAIGRVKNPHRLVSVLLDMAGSETQTAIENTGMGPFVDAIIAHAQNQLWVFSNSYGKFADIDLACRALDRFHRLILAVCIITESDHSSQWANRVAGLIRQISQLIEPRLRRVDSDIRIALRKPRVGADEVDPELLLEALNGMYLLAAVKSARESLALNTILSAQWTITGKELEILVSRNLEAFRKDPGNDAIVSRMNAGIKMAEVRFNPEYADILKRAVASAER